MKIDQAEIIENAPIAENIWRLVFTSNLIADEYIGAGQFVLILVNKDWGHPLRRPMSIAAVKDNKISIIYKIIGPTTKELSCLNTDNYINVFGPFGNTFIVGYQKYTPVLVGGGIGLAPIFNLSNCLRQKGIEAITVYGAKTAAEHFEKHKPTNQLYLSSDDGSIGIKGTVIDALNVILPEISNPKIFACGPEIMLSALQKMLKKSNIPAQFSVESYMACGIGICQGCAISDNQNSYNLVCKKGPIFESNEVIFG